MYFKAAVLLFLVISDAAFASISGQGKASGGLSYDNTSFNSGLDASYTFIGRSLYQNYAGDLKVEEVANDDQVSPIIGHSYLYGGDSRAATLSHRISTEDPYFFFNTDGQYTENGDIALSDNTTWVIRTGPQYIRKIRSDITLDAQYFYYKQDTNGYLSQQDDSSIAIRKAIKGGTLLSVEYLYSCINYANEEIIDFCKDKYSIGIAVDYADYKYDVEITEVVKADNKNVVYETNYSYFLNSANNILIGYKKEDTNIPLRVLLVTDELSTTDSIITTSKTLKYTYSYRRLKFGADYAAVKYEVADITRSESTFKSDAEYLTSGALCQSCYVVASYSQSQNEIMDWHSFSMGINIPFKREWSRSFFLRRTMHEDGESITSINFLLNYDGQAKVLSR